MIITVNNKIYILCYVEYLILFYDEIFIGIRYFMMKIYVIQS